MKFMGWAEPFRKLGVRANADTPRDAKAREFGAEGIGLCRTEHMFFGDQTAAYARHDSGGQRERSTRRAEKIAAAAARRLCRRLSRDGWISVTIRTLDPPLHEFLPRREDLMVEIAWARSRRRP